MIAEEGPVSAARWLLLQMVQDFKARGTQNIPADGPLVIASNHPGTVDSIAIHASVGRPDLRAIASDVPFLKNLGQVKNHLIFVPRSGIEARMIAMRESIRHLESGGALLLFAHGTIDPDPAFMPGAAKELNGWSRSLDIFLDRVPEIRVVTTIVSDVLDPRYMRHPLTWLQRTRVDRQRLAMMIQVIQQMLGKKLNLVPRVSFGEAIDLREARKAGDSREVVVEAAKGLLRTHVAWQP
jgi:hypothetical protein